MSVLPQIKGTTQLVIEVYREDAAVAGVEDRPSATIGP